MSRGFPLQDTGPGMNELFHDLAVEQEEERAAARTICECPRCGRSHNRLGTPPGALTNDELCHLSRLFNELSTLRDERDIRINEWLKQQIAASLI
jgi:hypothetical protein